MNRIHTIRFNFGLHQKQVHIGIAENQSNRVGVTRSKNYLMALLNQLLATIVALLQSLLGGL
ncbi:hypothetical protein FHW36_107404 [Chitinophaga polysaccharea]|uniref:Uncharacterized protein n=1 Tax=Chitinophaga polysaccharea TaxID=1293035 RepID=A0A561PH83_9BACT|nr:hypothetical protein FHW36_107404 [Chitinophaga polysaccharea]